MKKLVSFLVSGGAILAAQATPIDVTELIHDEATPTITRVEGAVRSSTEDVDHAFDRSTNSKSGRVMFTTTNGTIQCDIPATFRPELDITLVSYKLKRTYDNDTWDLPRAPTVFKLQALVGGNWVTIHEKDAENPETGWSTSVKEIEYEIPEANWVSSRSYRFVIAKGNGSTDGVPMSLDELSFIIDPDRIGNKYSVEAAYDAENVRADVDILIERTKGDTARVTIDYPTNEGEEQLVVSENAVASATPLSAQVPLVADRTSELVVSVISGGKTNATSLVVHAGCLAVAKGADADVNTGTAGSFVISRGTGAAAPALAVSYTVASETAVAGVDYEAFSGVATIPAGESEVTVVVTPKVNPSAANDQTLTLTLEAGLYGLSEEAKSTSLTLKGLSGYWTYDATAKTITDDAGWVFGVTESGANLVVASATTIPEGATALNLAKPVLDAGKTVWPIIQISGSVLKNNCTTLKTLLLPETLTYIGNAAFQGCPIEGDLTLGYGSAGKLKIDHWAFSKHHLTTIHLGPRMYWLGSGTFEAASEKTLLDVELPDTLEHWDAYPFSGCTALTNITHCFPKGLTYITHSAVSGLSKLGGTLNFACGDTAFGGGQNTACGTSFEAIRFGKKFTGVFTSNNSFSWLTKLRHIYVECDNLFDFKGTYAFSDRVKYGVIVHVPEASANWQGVLSDTAQVTPWSLVSDEAKAKFKEYFPNERKPKGLIIAQWSSTGSTDWGNSLRDAWITDDAAVVSTITIVGDPDNYGTPSIPYGATVYTSLTASTNCVIDEFIPVGPTLYRTTGYTAHYLDEEGEVVETVKGDTCSFNLGDLSRSISLIWHFEPVAYRAEITFQAAEGRGVTEDSTPTFHGYYKVGDTQTYTVVGEGFTRWYGDVPEGSETSRTISIATAAGQKLQPYFPGATWTVAADGKSMSNGYWTLATSASGKNLTISGSQGACAALDLTTAVSDDYVITQIGQNAFKDKAALKYVTFAETITSIGNYAFAGCPLEGDLTVGYGTGSNLTLGHWAFQGHRFVTIHLGPRVTYIGSGTFDNQTNKTLLDVELSDSIQHWDAYPFANCGTMTNVTHCLPKNINSITHSALSGFGNVRGTLEFCCGETAYGGAQNSANGSGFDAIRFGKKFTGICKSNNSFSYMTNLKHIYVEGDNTFDFQGTYAFSGRKQYGVIVHVPNPEDSANWAAVLADPEQVTPWSEVSDEAKAAFTSNFPNTRRPKGLIIGQWSSTGSTDWGNSLRDAWITYDNKPGFVILVR